MAIVDSILEPQVAISTLATQVARTAEFLASVPPNLERHRYAAGKWSIREVVGHVIDLERVFGFRAFCIGRGDSAELPGIDCDQYQTAAGYDERPLAELTDQLIAVRRANLAFMSSMGPLEFARRGVAGGAPWSVSQILSLLVSHEAHHMRVIAERYLTAPVR